LQIPGTCWRSVLDFAILSQAHSWDRSDRDLDLGPDSNLPLWDGTRPDYDWAVSALLRAG
jgi:hypothetical protein